VAELVAAVGPDARPVWVDAAWLAERGVDGAALPLWEEGRLDQELAVDPGKALGAGLAPRSFADTARDTLAWLQDGGSSGSGRALGAEREAALLEEWHARA
jgi:hypothetical protein